MTHEKLKSLLPAYALDALEGAELRALLAHLQGGCASCERSLAQYRRVAEGLLLSVAERSPRPELKAALMARVTEKAPAALRASFWTWPLQQWRPLAAGFAALALLLWMWSGQGWMLRRPVSAPALPAAPSPQAKPAVEIAAGRPGHVQLADLNRRAHARRSALARAHASLPELALRSGSLTQGGLAVAPGGPLAWGPGLFTGKDGAEIVVDRRAVLLLKPYTQVNLSLQKAQVFADLDHGTLFTAVVPGTAFSVRSAGASVDAHGTMFLVSRVASNRVYVCICRGKIDVHAPGLDHEMAAATDAQEAGLTLTLAPGGAYAQAAQAVNYAREEEAVGEAMKDMPGAEPVGTGNN
ncbi:MAG TPA: hypothetical protein VK914_00070 [bacterium]|jgi:hypothetical protein|nr:hypothetical protein [bacterium]